MQPGHAVATKGSRPKALAIAVIAVILGMVYLTLFTLIALRGNRPASDCVDRIASARAGFLDSAVKADHTWVRRQEGHWVVGVLFHVRGSDRDEVTVVCHHTSALAVHDTTYRVDVLRGNQLDELKRASASVANPVTWLASLIDSPVVPSTRPER